MLSESLWAHHRAWGEDVSYDNFTNLDEFLQLKPFDQRSDFKNMEVPQNTALVIWIWARTLLVALYDNFN